METVTIYVAQDYNEQYQFSAISFQHLSDNGINLMPGGCEEVSISKDDYDKLLSDSSYWLDRDENGKFFVAS